MKTLILITIISLLSLSLNAQRPGDLNLDFSGDGIYIEDWIDTTCLAKDIGVLSDGNIIIGANYWGIAEGNGCVLKIDDQGNFVPFGNFPRGYEFNLFEDESIKAIYILPDDKIVVAGDMNGETFLQPFVFRLLPNGQPDETFGTDGVYTDGSIQMEVTDMEIYSLENSYKIVLSGNNNDSYPILLMIDNTGQPETSFGSGGVVEFNDHRARIVDLVIDSENGFLYTCGYISDGIGTIILKYNLSDGNPDTDFGDNGALIYSEAEDGFNGQTFASVLDFESNTLAVFGKYEHADGDYDMFAYRINTHDGTADTSFGVAGWSSLRSPVSNEVIALAVLQSDGKYYFGANTDFYGTFDLLIGRINHNGSADTSFGINGLVVTVMENTDVISGLALSPTEDMLYIAGNSEPEMAFFEAAYYTGYESEPPISIYNNQRVTFSCFPNPTSGKVTIIIGTAGLHLVQVYDIAGKELFNKNYTGERVDLDLEFLQPSVYFIRVSLPDGQAITSKLVRN